MLLTNKTLGKYTIECLIKSALGAATLSLVLTPGAATAQQQTGNRLVVPGVNATQTTMANTIIGTCPSGKNEPQFQTRCNNVVGAALDGQQTQVLNSLQQVAPEQVISQGTQATKILQGGTLNFINLAIVNRLTALRAGVEGIGITGTQFALGGSPFSGANSFAAAWPSRPVIGGAASADGADIFSKLGAFLNVVYNFGDVDSTFNQKGFNYDIAGVTAGVDYRLTNNLVFGAAFNYLGSSANFNNSAGNMDSNAYSGSLYGTYYVTDSFYIDGIASYGGIDYDTRRKIQYAIAPNQLDPNGDIVNATAKGSPGGGQYSVSFGGGYDYATGALTVGPYTNVNYTELQVDSYSEHGGAGWAMHFGEQQVRSLTTTLGTQLSYAVSMPWGVLLPQSRAEWHHEFENDSRKISARFLGALTPAPGLENFQIFTGAPDRDYFNLGFGVSATFARGMAAFFDYDMLLGYGNITSYKFVVGGRLEF